MSRLPNSRPTRRTMLGLTAAGALTAALPATARADTGSAGTPSQGALAARGQLWLSGGQLLHGTVLQSFAVDERHGHLYALQVMQGGVRLEGERRSYSYAERLRRGDLCLNRLSLSGRLTGAMHLKGFGHGTTLGLQETPGGVLLWTECDADPASGYGRAICRFSFADEAITTLGTPGVAVFRPVPGSTGNCAAADAAGDRLLVRYHTTGAARLRLYGLAAFAEGDFRPLADFTQPGAGSALPFQGLALHGGSAYQLLGSAYGPGNPVSSMGNTRLYRIDVHTGRVEQQARDTTATRLYPREPEGLAVLRSGGPWLCLGYTEGRAGDKRFSLYRKRIP